MKKLYTDINFPLIKGAQEDTFYYVPELNAIYTSEPATAWDYVTIKAVRTKGKPVDPTLWNAVYDKFVGYDFAYIAGIHAKTEGTKRPMSQSTSMSLSDTDTNNDGISYALYCLFIEHKTYPLISVDSRYGLKYFKEIPLNYVSCDSAGNINNVVMGYLRCEQAGTFEYNSNNSEWEISDFANTMSVKLNGFISSTKNDRGAMGYGEALVEFGEVNS